MKRTVPIFTILALLLTMAAGCAQNTGSSTAPSTVASSSSSVAAATATEQEKIDLTCMMTTNREPWIGEAIKVFMDENPNITITPTYESAGNLRTNLMVAASSGTLPSFWYHYSGARAGFFPANGLTYNLNDYAASHDWKNLFAPGLLDYVTFDGVISGYPQTINTFNIIYRKDIFEKYNLQIPQTFEEFEKTMAALKANGIIPLGVGGKTGIHLLRVYYILLEMYAGSENHDKLYSGELGWDSEYVRQTMAKAKEWSDAGYFPDGMITLEQDDGRVLFFTGKAAMVIDGPALLFQMYNDGEDLNNYGEFSFPATAGNKGSRLATYATQHMFNAKLTEAELDAAMKFTEFALNDARFDKLKDYPMPYANSVIPEHMEIVGDILKDNEEHGGQMPADQFFPAEISNEYILANESVITGSASVEDAAKKLQKAIETIGKK